MGVVDKEPAVSPLTGPLRRVEGGMPLKALPLVVDGGGGELAELQYDMDMEVLARVRETLGGRSRSSVKSHKHMRVSWPMEPIR